MKTLIVDDEVFNRMYLKNIMEKLGDCVTAENGKEGIEVFEKENPDIIIMDIMMPVMDGYEATKIIKEKTRGYFVPVICLTALDDEEELAKCIEAGADDFLSKPITRTILHAKINAMMRIRELYKTINMQKNELTLLLKEKEQEQKIAKKVFTKIVYRGCLDDEPSITHWISPMAIFNGDTLLAARRPSGELHVLVGDFTGHGLSAALSAILLADVFYSMTDEGFNLSEIMLSINEKLKNILPVNLFLAACALQIDHINGNLSVWIGAFSDLIIVGSKGGIKRRLTSKNLPLGIVDNNTLNSTIEMTAIEDGDRICVFTDGVTEAKGKNGEMFGQERLDEVLGRYRGDGHNPLERVRDEIVNFSNFAVDNPQTDDITMMEILYSREDTKLITEVEASSAETNPRTPPG